MKDFKLLSSRFLNGDLNLLTGVSFEFLLLFLSACPKPVAVVLSREFVEETASICADQGVQDSLFFFHNNKKTIIKEGFSTYFSHLDLACRQSLELSGINKKTLFIEDSSLNLKNISLKRQRSVFLVGASCSFEKLLKQLNSLSYISSSSLPPGSFFVRGGVVDVCSFGSPTLYRISFLEEETKIYRVHRNSNLILSQIKSLSLASVESEKNKFSIKKILEKNKAPLFYYNNNNLYFKGNQKKICAVDAQGVDFQTFRKKYKNKKKTKIPFPVERGLIYKNSLFIPTWFLNPSNRLTAPEPVNKNPIFSFVVGGLYVHEDFGYCQFLGLESLKNQERLCLKFSDGIVKLDVNNINRVFFYDAACSRPLSSLSKTGAWKKTLHSNTKKAQDFVDTLIKTYKKRDDSLSPPINIKDPLIEDFVGAFKHIDTEDQEACWQQILNDFASGVPLNRLICGDVGFGKTEMAIRASFVAALNNQQVLVLAPTTILANQLFDCFVSRLSNFGVFVGVLSGISKKNPQTIQSFINGSLDVIIGTSALLFQQKLLFSCGLFVVDEEHRFGVRDKEKILEINPKINFLSMSATPIPRSLQLSLNNIRNLSLLSSPPKNRRPIISNVSYFSLDIIKSSVLREVGRGGQVYIVDNSVSSLKKLKKEISSHFSNLCVEIIYGGLSGESLINIMSKFLNNKIQVLLTTTIIESGIDVALSNTIIINNAHCFGLSQLYQLRGRVGRSSQQAYAWFLIPQKHTLSENAKKRLGAILKHTALGVGYQISQEDLKIRGAGSLFGYSQSGQGGIGFELYSKLLSRAASEKQGGDKNSRCFVDIFSVKIPERVFEDVGVRAAYYKSIYGAENPQELSKIKETILQEFGVFVSEFELLFKNKNIEFLGREKGVKEIVIKKNVVSVVFHLSLVNHVFDELLAYINVFFHKEGVSFRFTPSYKNLIFQYIKTSKDDYILLCSFLKNITFV